MSRVLLCVLVVACSALLVASVHPHGAAVLSEVSSASESVASAAPGSHCFSTHNALPAGSEGTPVVFSTQTFCNSVVEGLAEPFPTEKEFREACVGMFGADKCLHQCRELAQLFDAAIVTRAPGGGISRGNPAGYAMQQADCEYCLKFHQCTPKSVVV